MIELTDITGHKYGLMVSHIKMVFGDLQQHARILMVDGDECEVLENRPEVQQMVNGFLATQALAAKAW
jgi:hypothetical protein